MNSKYGTKDLYQNYYNYKLKGNYEPARFGFDYEPLQDGEIEFSTKAYIRITGDEKQKADAVVNTSINARRWIRLSKNTCCLFLYS